MNLLPGGASAATADTPDMVAARASFLAKGHFSGLRSAVCDLATRHLPRPQEGAAEPPAFVDVGAGTGYYLAGLLDTVPEAVGLAVDLSKYALRRASRAHERLGAVVCDAWQGLPVGDSIAAVVLDVFAPRNALEFRRILRRDGHLVVVTPAANHLEELVSALGLLSVDAHKQRRLQKTFADVFVQLDSLRYENTLRLNHEEATALATMGPSAHHLQNEPLRIRLEGLPDPITVTVSVDVSVYRPIPEP